MPSQTLLVSVSYGLGFLAYAVLAVRLALPSGKSPRGQLLLAACIASALWELSGWVHGNQAMASSRRLHEFADVLRWTLWMAFLTSIVVARSPGLKAGWVRPAALAGSTLAIAAAILTASLYLFAGTVHAFGLWVIASIAGLVLCEQVFRSTPPDGRWAIKPLCIAVAAIFGFDLFLFSDATMMRLMDSEFWAARGIAHALPIPLLLIASARNRAWSIDVAVSRAFVFRSSALLISGMYLLAASATGYYVRLFGGEWGKAVQVVFLSAALIVLVVLFTSGSLRARVKVYINKNFFSYRYDYREEWLRFTARLSGSEAAANVYERAIGALADLVESPSGALWMRTSEGMYRPAASWNVSMPSGEAPADSDFIRFLGASGWVIDLEQPQLSALKDQGLSDLPDWLRAMPDAWLVIPMATDDGLLGFTVLLQPRAPVEINWEVLDLLKTAARQAASYLGHITAAEALLEARQFDAFHKMSAFVVHDLKNLSAQLSLLLSNAERHVANPEFQRDMLETVKNVVERMNRLLAQLRSGETPVERPHLVELAPLVRRVSKAYGNHGCALDVSVEPGVRALGHEDRLERVIGHLVQNAIEASQAQSTVRVNVHRDPDGRAAIEVADEGAGMSPQFIRDELFKPFRTTKASGMGIGAYESRQYVAEIGGQMTVDSAPGQGTRFVILLQGSPGAGQGIDR